MSNPSSPLFPDLDDLRQNAIHNAICPHSVAVKGVGGGGVGGLHQNSLEIDFIVVSDRGE